MGGTIYIARDDEYQCPAGERAIYCLQPGPTPSRRAQLLPWAKLRPVTVGVRDLVSHEEVVFGVNGHLHDP
jgi:hypothetical protein